MVFSYGIGVFAFIFPAPMVRLSDRMGLVNSGAMFSMSVYRRDRTYENLIDALYRQIDAGRHGNVIRLFENLDDDQQDNASGFHRQAYVNALINRERSNDAVRFIDFEYMADNIDLSRPCFIYFVFVENNWRGVNESTRLQMRENFIAYAREFEYVFMDATISDIADYLAGIALFLSQVRAYYTDFDL